MKGTISLDVAASGPIDDPSKMQVRGGGSIAGFELADASLRAPITGIGAALALGPDSARLTGLTASLGRSRLGGSCTITRFAHPVVDVALDVPLLDVDEILSFLPEGGAPAKPEAASGGAAAPSTLADVTVRGTIAVREARAMNLKLTAASADVSVRGGEARLDGVRATLYGGALAGAVTTGLIESGPPFGLSAKLQGVDFNALCTDFSKDLAGLVHGTLETTLDVQGRGLDSAGLRKSLDGSASLALRKGKLASFGFLKQLAQVLQAAGGRGIGRDETPFDALTATFKIAGGRAATEDLRLHSPDLDMTGKGSIGLDQTLAMNTETALSPAVTADMVARTSQLKALVNGKGELALALRLGGTLQKPSIGLDPNMLKRAAQETLKEKGKDVLKRWLDKKRKP